MKPVRALIRGAVLAVICGGAAGASVMDRSLFPKPRPVIGVPELKPVFGPGPHIVRPRPRPTRIASVAREVSPPRAASNAPLRVSLIPKPRPIQTTRTASAPVRSTSSSASSGKKVGPICGRRDILGTRVSDIRGERAGCGVSDPVRVVEVSGVALSSAATMDCTTAKALNEWVEDGVQPIVGRLGGGVAKLNVAAGYSCRTRNNKPGAKISEHGKGKAIDISAITLENGKVLSVANGWNQRADGKVLKKLHAAACGPFGTVLGPEADKHHRDHFHFDTARHSGGSYCR